MSKISKTEMKTKAQLVLMQGIANQLGYYDPTDFGEDMTEEQQIELRQVMQAQADRVARMFGYESAWSN